MRMINKEYLEDKCKRQMNNEWNKQVAPSSWAEAYEKFLEEIDDCVVVDAVPIMPCEGYVWWLEQL